MESKWKFPNQFAFTPFLCYSQKLVEALLEATCKFLERPCEVNAKNSVFDPFGGFYCRAFVCLAVARFITLLASNSSLTPTSRSYLNWRLLTGILDLVDVEIERQVGARRQILHCWYSRDSTTHVSSSFTESVCKALGFYSQRCQIS